MLNIIFYSFRCEFSDVVLFLLSPSFLLLSISFLMMMRFPGDRKSGRYSWYQSIRLSEYLGSEVCLSLGSIRMSEYLGSVVVSFLRERTCNFYMYLYIYISMST